MNTIAAFLSLQAESIKEESAIAVLKEAEGRVFSMMLLYEKLYQSDIKTHIKAENYIAPLVDEIISMFPHSIAITVEKRISDFSISAEIVQPIGIIINELLTNIMKYAFIGRNEGRITVSASSSGNMASLIIQDNGNGIPESINFKNSTGFGLMLIEILTKQLNGTIRIERENGTTVIMEFKLTNK